MKADHIVAYAAQKKAVEIYAGQELVARLPDDDTQESAAIFRRLASCYAGPAEVRGTFRLKNADALINEIKEKYPLQ